MPHGQFLMGPGLQLQDALKCQHCRKQFKSKAGLNYHTMAEHSAKVCPWARLPAGPDPWPSASHSTHPTCPALTMTFHHHTLAELSGSHA